MNCYRRGRVEAGNIKMMYDSNSEAIIFATVFNDAE